MDFITCKLLIRGKVNVNDSDPQINKYCKFERRCITNKFYFKFINELNKLLFVAAVVDDFLCSAFPPFTLAVRSLRQKRCS